jgi:hypothetical protein
MSVILAEDDYYIEAMFAVLETRREQRMDDEG